MPTINFITLAGDHVEISAEAGISLMEAATNNGVPGIIAECGGALACGSCHVYVDQQLADLLGAPNPMEYDMLADGWGEYRATSRLSCQITLTDEMDGATVEIAQNQ